MGPIHKAKGNSVPGLSPSMIPPPQMHSHRIRHLSVASREEFGDLLRSGFSSVALLRRITRTVMWTCTTGLRRSSRRHGGTRSPCWWHEDAPKWVFTRPKRTGLGAFWTFITWTTTTRRLTTSKPPVQW